ncbi:uroporphyrinogen-III synthase [Paenibacillus sp. PAMC21692]|uniref:uroporphyrinogen-III synthase n=1 Tax=Paenibacillus sp. PAMC21692 TaxID=2762320 RepID=UPI00164ED028|nr:uroporphyrinogen-III synthase [Paenibacillus sp. PAMC21692]QNK58246.1 uroporphyrinogen-III synthase [Paenibacillus sp. PAMC21692]
MGAARMAGVTVAVTGPRKAEEIGRMIAKFGGETVVRPAQGTVFLDDSIIEEQLRELIRHPADWLLLTTGVGTEALLQTAERHGLTAPFLAALGKMNIGARGYKTVNVLRKIGITPVIRDNDGTTAGMLAEMGDVGLHGKRVVLQLYGDPAPKITGKLRELGAVCEELLPYRHVPPEGDSVEVLIDEVLRSAVQAVAFTSTVQVRCVMHIAESLGKREALLRAFGDGVLAVAVGKVTAEALTEEGVERVLYPDEERMGSMVVAISKYYGSQSASGGEEGGKDKEDEEGKRGEADEESEEGMKGKSGKDSKEGKEGKNGKKSEADEFAAVAGIAGDCAASDMKV